MVSSIDPWLGTSGPVLEVVVEKLFGSVVLQGNAKSSFGGGAHVLGECGRSLSVTSGIVFLFLFFILLKILENFHFFGVL